LFNPVAVCISTIFKTWILLNKLAGMQFVLNKIY
jgi:hypothetical protein